MVGTELTVSVLGNDEPFALPVVEIVPAKGFYDYEAKYTPGATEEIVPARISPDETAMAQEIALAAHRCARVPGRFKDGYYREWRGDVCAGGQHHSRHDPDQSPAQGGGGGWNRVCRAAGHVDRVCIGGGNTEVRRAVTRNAAGRISRSPRRVPRNTASPTIGCWLGVSDVGGGRVRSAFALQTPLASHQGSQRDRGEARGWGCRSDCRRSTRSGITT